MCIRDRGNHHHKNNQPDGQDAHRAQVFRHVAIFFAELTFGDKAGGVRQPFFDDLGVQALISASVLETETLVSLA